VEVPDVARRASWAVFLKVHGRRAAGGKGQTYASARIRNSRAASSFTEWGCYRFSFGQGPAFPAPRRGGFLCRHRRLELTRFALLSLSTAS
jgi:hypothetical protein